MNIRKYLETFKILINNDYPCDNIMKTFDKPLLIVQKKNNNESVVIWLNEKY